jgi:hypothetical protein
LKLVQALAGSGQLRSNLREQPFLNADALLQRRQPCLERA